MLKLNSNYHRVFIITFTFIVLTLKDLVWLGVIIILISIGIFTVKYAVFARHNNYLKNIIKSFFVLSYIFLSIITIRSFFVDLFLVPSGSMESTLIAGDIIIVNKFRCSGLLTIFDPSSGKLKSSSLENIEWATIDNGDVLVYQHHKSFAVKRCVAISGDTISIKNGSVFIGSNAAPIPITAKERYIIHVPNELSYFKIFDSLRNLNRLKFYDFKKHELIGEYTASEVIVFKNKYKATVNKFSIFNHDRQMLFVNPQARHWTPENMGPIFVPHKGTSTKLTPFTVSLYRHLIEEDGKTIAYRDGLCLIDGKAEISYQFLKNYYFVIGDNRHKSVDSRSIGLINQDSIVGLAQFILFSSNNNSFKWDRLFKRIH